MGKRVEVQGRGDASGVDGACEKCRTRPLLDISSVECCFIAGMERDDCAVTALGVLWCMVRRVRAFHVLIRAAAAQNDASHMVLLLSVEGGVRVRGSGVP